MLYRTLYAMHGLFLHKIRIYLQSVARSAESCMKNALDPAQIRGRKTPFLRDNGMFSG